MKTIKEALNWSGSGATLSMFVVGGAEPAPELAMAFGAIRPLRVRMYELEDEATVLGGRRVTEYDAEFRDVPKELDGYLLACMHEATESGSEVVWFGFEGSFSFEFFLDGAIASQIYALEDSSGAVVATDEVLRSDPWRERIIQSRDRALPSK
jgi:hypothetical protein